MSATLLALDGNGRLRIDVRGVTPPRDCRIEAEWSRSCRANPRLFDGRILAVRGIDAVGGVIHAVPERFSHVVCAAEGVSQPVTILSVTGVIECVMDGCACVLVGRRGSATRSYPGMWELAPAGGLHAVEGRALIGFGHVLATLAAELQEEAGIVAPLLGARAVALVADPFARSVDIIVRARLEEASTPPEASGAHEWEYSSLRWVPIVGFGAFASSARGGVIEPTLAVARWLGWIV